MSDIAAAVAAVRAGEVIGLPTDTVYGIGADPHDPAAINRIFELKRRPQGLPLVLLVSSVAEAFEIGRFDSVARSARP